MERSFQQNVSENSRALENPENMDSVLEFIASTASQTGLEFFQNLVLKLSSLLNAEFGLVTRVVERDPMRVQTLAFSQHGRIAENLQYLVETTPCETVYKNGFSYFPESLQALFPEDRDLETMGADSYMGAPLLCENGQCIGHLCVLGSQPVGEEKYARHVLKILASRAGAELGRLRAEEELIYQRDHLMELVDEKTVELQNALRRAEEGSEAKTIFLGRMSHEFRTPLNAIIGFADLLKSEETIASEPDLKTYIEGIQKAGWHLTEMVKDILDISLIESDQIKLDMDRCYLPHLSEECVELIRPAAQKKNISIEHAPDAFECSWIQGDCNRLKQIILNLLSNAVKYNKEGGSMHIYYSEPTCCNVRLHVADTGIGIPEEAREKVFEVFERFHNKELVIEGTGIGLALTKRLVEHMGGKIGVESNKDGGSTFWVELTTVNKDGKQPVAKR